MHGGYGMGSQGLGFSDGVFLFLFFFFFLPFFVMRRVFITAYLMVHGILQLARVLQYR